jgi:hypothetical protein
MQDLYTNFLNLNPILFQRYWVEFRPVTSRLVIHDETRGFESRPDRKKAP